MEEEFYLGYIKYEGRLVEEGLMDARQQAYALLGFDSAIRHLIGKQAPDFSNLDFEIPIRIRKGSWEALIPSTVAGWVQTGLGVVATAYFSKAAQKMADKDFADFGLTDLFKKSLDAIKWFVKIGKHMGDLSIRRFENTKFSDDHELIGIRNANGEYLYVPRNILDMYISSSPKLLNLLAQNIAEGRTRCIGTFVGSEVDEVTVQLNEKGIFCEEQLELDEELLFPELVHGEQVILEGEVTRENKTSNSMGFKYRDHILSAYPESGNIVPYKPLLFLNCRLHGTVDRIDEKGRIAARRPKLHFSRLEPLDPDNKADLFS